MGFLVNSGILNMNAVYRAVREMHQPIKYGRTKTTLANGKCDAQRVTIERNTSAFHANRRRTSSFGRHEER